MDITEKLLQELTDAPGVPGYEAAVRAIMRREMGALGAAIEQDALGSIIGKLPGKADRPRIMLAGHMDEVGFMVRFITENGFIRFLPLGGWWDQVLLAHQVIIKTAKGDITGMIGAKPPHLLKEDERKKVVEKDDMYIDVGASSRQEVEEMGVRVGDPIIPRAPFTIMAGGKSYLGKAWDDRVGCALIIEVMRALGDRSHPNTIYGVGTVQEEVGLRGARTSAFAVNPDVGLVMEVGLPGDVPDSKAEEAAVKLGGGVEIMVYEGSMLPNLRLRDLAIDTAREIGVPVQLGAIPRGGTDGGQIHIHARGVPSLVLCVPARHIHTNQGIIRRDDFDAAVRLSVELVKRLDAQTVAGLTE